MTAYGDDAARDVELRGTQFAHVLTSPLQRAQQTCALAELESVPAIEADLAEWDNGDDEGQTPTDILASRKGWNLYEGGEIPQHTQTNAADLSTHEEPAKI